MLWSLETTRHEPKINMEEKLVDVIEKLRHHGKRDQLPKLYVVTLLIFPVKRATQFPFFFF